MLRILIIALTLLPCVASASSVVAVPEAEMLARADAVVVGSVSQLEPYWDDRLGIRTRARLQVHHGVRGASDGDVLTLDVPGGILAGLSTQVSGAPRLVQGQLMLVFLEAYGQVYRPLGLSYGVYNVALSDASWHAVRDLNGMALLNKRGQVMDMGMVRSGEDLNAMLLRLQEQAKKLDGLK